MNTCEICDAPVRIAAQNTPIRHGPHKYHVCSYTCETVLYETFAAVGNDSVVST